MAKQTEKSTQGHPQATEYQAYRNDLLGLGEPDERYNDKHKRINPRRVQPTNATAPNPKNDRGDSI